MFVPMVLGGSVDPEAMAKAVWDEKERRDKERAEIEERKRRAEEERKEIDDIYKLLGEELVRHKDEEEYE